ncbi:MAG: helix-turn-helix domain-containing protein [Deltaproteobacteria bacterium]|nr:helix-turn-helix domain-containing protein [Deltaproteobacteria bacterium]
MELQRGLPWTKRVFRPDEVAQILALSRRTVYRMIRDGRLPGVKDSGPWRVPWKTLERLLAGELSPHNISVG